MERACVLSWRLGSDTKENRKHINDCNRGFVIEELVGNGMADGRRPPVEKVGGCSKGFDPVRRWHVGMDQVCTTDIVQSA